MAALTFYIKNAAASGSSHGSLQQGGTAPSTATTGTGWTVAKITAPNYALMIYATTRASTVFTTTAVPSAGPTTTDCWRSENTLTGTFASGNFTVAISFISTSTSATQDGRFRVRIWKSSNATGTGAVELASGGVVQSTIATNLTTSAQNLTATVAVNQNLTFTAEYLFIQVAWEVTGAGSANACDVIFRTDGTNSKITTTSFSAIYDMQPATDNISVTDSIAREEQFARVNNDTAVVTDSGAASLEKTSVSSDTIAVGDTLSSSLFKVVSGASSDTAVVSDQCVASGNFPYLTSKALSLFVVAPFAVPWAGRDTLGGTSYGRDLKTAGDDPTVGSAVNGRVSSVWTAAAPTGDTVPFTIFGANLIYDFRDYDATTGVYDNLYGTDATQATSGSRPLRVKFGDGVHYGIVLDGIDDYEDAGDVTNLDALTGITVSVAFKLKKDTSYGPFISKAWTNCNFFFGVSPQLGRKLIELEVGGTWLGGAGARADDYWLADDEWHVAVGVYNGAIPEVYLWIDGVLQKTRQSPTKTVPTSLPDVAETLQIGGRSESGDATYKLKGELTRPLIVNRAATPAEVARLTAFYISWLAFTYPWRDETAVAWWDAQYGVTVTGSGVSEVLDRTENGNTITQATDARRPPLTATTAAYGNKPTFDYSGSVDTNLVGSVAVDAPLTIYFAGHRSVGLTNHYFFDFNAGNYFSATDYIGIAGVQQYNGGSNVAIGHRADAPHIYCFTIDAAGDALMFIDDMTTPVAKYTGLGAAAITSITLGNYAGLGLAFRGPIACMGIFKTKHDATKRKQIGDWIANEYGLTWVEPTHPTQISPAIMFERPNYNPTASQWSWRRSAGAFDLEPTGVQPWDAGGAPIGDNGTTDFLRNVSATIDTWATGGVGTTPRQFYARVRTTSITATTAYYSAHAIFTDSGQYTGLFLRTDGAGVFEAGFLDYGSGAAGAIVDISHVVDSTGKGEFSLQAKRNANNDLYIRVNDEPWVAGSQLCDGTSGGGHLEVGGGTNSAELNGEVLAIATWVGAELSPQNSRWLARWEPKASPIRLSGKKADALFLKGRYNDTANGGLGVWYNSHGGNIASGFNVTAPGEPNPASIKIPYELSGALGSPTYVLSNLEYFLYDSTTVATFLGGVSADFSTWAWVRPTSITYTETSNPWDRHVIWISSDSFVGLILYKNSTSGVFYALFHIYDLGGFRTAEVDISGLVDSNGAGEFTIAARRSAGVMSVAVSGGEWVTGSTSGNLSADTGFFQIGANNTPNGFFDGAIFGVGTWANYVMTDADKARLEDAARDLFDPTEEAATLLKQGDFAIGGSDSTVASNAAAHSQDSDIFGPNANTKAVNFTASAVAVITKTTFTLKKFGAPTGNIYGLIYADNGGEPGELLATSEPLNITTLTTSYVAYDLLFYGGVRVEAGVDYWIGIKYAGGDGSNLLFCSMSTAAGYSGVTKYIDSGLWMTETVDLRFAATTRAGATWTPEKGLVPAAFNVGAGVPAAVSGAPDFTAGAGNTDRLYLEGLLTGDAMGAEECAGYVVVDLDTIAALVSLPNMWTNQVIWAGQDANSGLHIWTSGGVAYAGFYQFIGAALVAVTKLPRTSGKVFIAWRKWKGKLWISADGQSWVEGDAAGTFPYTTTYMVLGYAGYGVALDGRILEVQWIGGAMRGLQWLRGAFEHAVRQYAVPRAYHPVLAEKTPQIYLDAADGVTQVGTVSQWDDQSGNARHLTQATAIMQPVYTSRNPIFEDMPSLRPDGVDDVLDSGSFGALLQPNETFVVCAWGIVGTFFVSDGTPTEVVSSGSRQAILDNGSSAGLYIFAGASDFPTPADLGGRPVLLRIVWNGANSKVYVNGVLLGTFNPGTDGFRSLRLFARYTSDSYWNGHLAHFSDWAGHDDLRAQRITKYLLERFFGFPATMSLTAWWEACGPVGWDASTGTFWPRPSMGTSGHFNRRLAFGGAGAAAASSKGHATPDLDGSTMYFESADSSFTLGSVMGATCASGAFYVDVDTLATPGVSIEFDPALITDTAAYLALAVNSNGVRMMISDAVGGNYTPFVAIAAGAHRIYWRWHIVLGLQIAVDDGGWTLPVASGPPLVTTGVLRIGANYAGAVIFDGRIKAGLQSDEWMTDEQRHKIDERWLRRLGE